MRFGLPIAWGNNATNPAWRPSMLGAPSVQTEIKFPHGKSFSSPKFTTAVQTSRAVVVPFSGIRHRKSSDTPSSKYRTDTISCAVSLWSVLSSRASENAGQARSLAISCTKMSPLKSSHRRAHVSDESGSFPICCTILSLFGKLANRTSALDMKAFLNICVRKRHLVLSEGVTDAIAGFIDMAWSFCKYRYSLRLAQISFKSFLELLHAIVFSNVRNIKALFVLRIVMALHIIAFQISNAFFAYQTHRFLVMLAITKKILMFPSIVKRSLSGTVKATFFFEWRHSIAEDDLVLSDGSSGFPGIQALVCHVWIFFK